LYQICDFVIFFKHILFSIFCLTWYIHLVPSDIKQIIFCQNFFVQNVGEIRRIQMSMENTLLFVTVMFLVNIFQYFSNFLIFVFVFWWNKIRFLFEQKNTKIGLLFYDALIKCKFLNFIKNYVTFWIDPWHPKSDSNILTNANFWVGGMRNRTQGGIKTNCVVIILESRQSCKYSLKI